MVKQPRKRITQPIDSFNTGCVIQKLEEALDILGYVSLQYEPSKKHTMTDRISRMALALRKNPGSEEIKKELDMLLDSYEKEYAWMNI